MTEIKFEKLETRRIPTNIAGKFIEVELYYSRAAITSSRTRTKAGVTMSEFARSRWSGIWSAS